MNALNFYAEKPPFMNISLHKDVTKRQPLDAAVLESLEGAEHIMEFGHHRAAFNWRICSLLVKDMPQEVDKCGAMRDYLAYLMDGIDQCAAKIIVEMNLRKTVKKFKKQNEDIKLGVVDIIDDLEQHLDVLFGSLDVDEELTEDTERRLINLIDSARTRASAKLGT